MPTWNLLYRLAGNGLKKFIYFSTVQVYGKLTSNYINESNICEPNNIYGLTHKICETICNYYNDNTDTQCINIRLANSFGKPMFLENRCWDLVIKTLV